MSPRAAKGLSLISGRERLSGALASGYFIAPTVLSNVANSMTIAREEIFGPVAAVIPFDRLRRRL